MITPFQGETVVDLDVPCTYDFDITASKYLASPQGGEVPLELLFSGTVFHRELSWEAALDALIERADHAEREG